MQRKLAWLGGIVLLAVVLWIAFSTEWKCYRVADNFLEHVTNGEFEQAFEYVSYFDEASDMSPTISYEEAKKIWVERMQTYQEQGMYFKSFEKLDTWTDDTYPEGMVTLTLVRDGKEHTIDRQDLYIHFNLLDDEWKVQMISSGSFPDDPLFQALSGQMPKTN